MRFSLLSLLSFTGVVLGDGCHYSGDDIGNYCSFNKDNDAFLNAASLYCNQFKLPFDVPKGDKQGNIYQIKIANVPDGYGGKQIFWGNYKVNKGPEFHLITYDECMGNMKRIDSSCTKDKGVYGGWVDTDFGTVFGECIRQ